MRHTRLNKTKEGDLRVYNIKNPPNEGDLYPVKDIYHAKKLIEALADSQLLQPEITSNVFGLEVYEDGEWMDWWDDEGRSSHEHFEEILAESQK